MLNDNLHIDS